MQRESKSKIFINHPSSACSSLRGNLCEHGRTFLVCTCTVSKGQYHVKVFLKFSVYLPDMREVSNDLNILTIYMYLNEREKTR